MLLAARALQGLGGALVFPTTLALINATFVEGRARNRALGIWGGSGAAGLVIGVLIGGLLTQAFGWEAVFFVNIALAGPLMPPRLLSNPNLITGVVIAFMFMATFGSVLYFLSIYFQGILGYDALQTGVGFLIPTAVVVAGSTTQASS